MIKINQNSQQFLYSVWCGSYIVERGRWTLILQPQVKASQTRLSNTQTHRDIQTAETTTPHPMAFPRN
jgi:hypothetical protein